MDHDRFMHWLCTLRHVVVLALAGAVARTVVGFMLVAGDTEK